MKHLALYLLFLLPVAVVAQQQSFAVQQLSLPPEISYFNNQFSGLFVHDGKLFLLGESRLQEKAEGKLYAINCSDLERKMNDTSFVLPYQKYPLRNLEIVRGRIEAAGQYYEGLEAVVFKGNTVYFSVETDTPSPDCFLLKGKLADNEVWMDTTYLKILPKPVMAGGGHVYNAGFEAMIYQQKNIFGFFEYNYFDSGSYVYKKCIKRNKAAKALPIKKLPFRITDITPTGKHQYTAINFFYKGADADSVYRIPASDPEAALMKNGSNFRSYCRLIHIEFTNNMFNWYPLWEFPAQYMDYNWEGIAAYNGGYFIMNDKYTPQKPYTSVLLYVKPQ